MDVDRWGDLEDALGLVGGKNFDRWGPEGRPDAIVDSSRSFIGHQTYLAPIEGGQGDIFVSAWQGQSMTGTQTLLPGDVYDGWGGDLSINAQPQVLEPTNAPWRSR